MKNTLAPHGTPQRYRWELRRGQTCPECREAWRTLHRHLRKVSPTSKPGKAYASALETAGFRMLGTPANQQENNQKSQQREEDEAA